MPVVTKIPARLHPATFVPLESTAKLKVAGYARVSTDSEEQQTSYAAQVSYYTDYIQKRPDWEFVGVSRTKVFLQQILDIVTALTA